jgi:MarR family 2-MHQ and catechol resistance regulon transcriptional repressor
VDSDSELRDSELRRDAEALTQVLTQLTRVIQLRDRDRVCRCAPEITVSQCYGLSAIVEGGSLSVNDLAAELLLDKSTVSRLVNQLETKGLITKAPDPLDRRGVRLEATLEGRRLSGAVNDTMIGENASILSDFSPEVRHGLITLAARLVRGLGEAVSVEAGCCSVVPLVTAQTLVEDVA